MATPKTPPPPTAPGTLDPFRRAVLRGLGVLLPPLLTIVIFLWVGSTVSSYVLTPLKDATRYVLVEYTSDIRRPDVFGDEAGQERAALEEGGVYARTGDGLYVPLDVRDRVWDKLKKKEPVPSTAREVYQRYVDDVWLQPWIVVPIFLSVFLLLLYTLGKFLAAGIGRFFWNQLESLITRVPLVSNVYSSVKQVTDFLFSETDLDITRIVAVEYPRKGIWTVAFVTGES
ncbi:MAG: DUF502 domain-containing protein, partial [Planctomycetota bacterium]